MNIFLKKKSIVYFEVGCKRAYLSGLEQQHLFIIAEIIIARIKAGSSIRITFIVLGFLSVYIKLFV